MPTINVVENQKCRLENWVSTAHIKSDTHQMIFKSQYLQLGRVKLTVDCPNLFRMLQHYCHPSLNPNKMLVKKMHRYSSWICILIKSIVAVKIASNKKKGEFKIMCLSRSAAMGQWNSVSTSCMYTPRILISILRTAQFYLVFGDSLSKHISTIILKKEKLCVFGQKIPSLLRGVVDTSLKSAAVLSGKHRWL